MPLSLSEMRRTVSAFASQLAKPLEVQFQHPCDTARVGKYLGSKQKVLHESAGRHGREALRGRAPVNKGNQNGETPEARPAPIFSTGCEIRSTDSAPAPSKKPLLEMLSAENVLSRKGFRSLRIQMGKGSVNPRLRRVARPGGSRSGGSLHQGLTWAAFDRT